MCEWNAAKDPHDPLLIHTIMGDIIFEQPIFTIFDIKQTLKCVFFFFHSKLYQKLQNSSGGGLFMSNVVNSANIGKTFRKVFHNSRGG